MSAPPGFDPHASLLPPNPSAHLQAFSGGGADLKPFYEALWETKKTELGKKISKDATLELLGIQFNDKGIEIKIKVMPGDAKRVVNPVVKAGTGVPKPAAGAAVAKPAAASGAVTAASGAKPVAGAAGATGALKTAAGAPGAAGAAGAAPKPTTGTGAKPAAPAAGAAGAPNPAAPNPAAPAEAPNPAAPAEAPKPAAGAAGAAGAAIPPKPASGISPIEPLKASSGSATPSPNPSLRVNAKRLQSQIPPSSAKEVGPRLKPQASFTLRSLNPRIKKVFTSLSDIPESDSNEENAAANANAVPEAAAAVLATAAARPPPAAANPLSLPSRSLTASASRKNTNPLSSPLKKPTKQQSFTPSNEL